jgi:hypothetical protein
MKKIILGFFLIFLYCGDLFATTQVKHYPDNNPVWVTNAADLN